MSATRFMAAASRSAAASFAKRGGFAYKHFWATRFDPAERYAAGDYPNQSAEAGGLPRWVQQGRSIEDEDLVEPSLGAENIKSGVKAAIWGVPSSPRSISQLAMRMMW